MDRSSAAIVKQWRLDYRPGAGHRRGVPWRGLRIGVLVVTAAAILAAIGVMLSWLHPAPRPVFVPICVSQYQSNELALLNVGQREQHTIDNSLFSARRVARSGKHDRLAITLELEKLNELSANDSAVICLSAHAVRGPEGQIVVLPADTPQPFPLSPQGSAERGEGAILLSSILVKLRACPCRHKLLVLDITRPLADAHLGVLADDVADVIASELIDVPDRDRLALCASSPGQTALFSPELGQSVFAYYFARGLQGEADGWHDGPCDGVVTVRELAAFVRERVDDWARHNRGTRQTPFLLGRGDDFALAAVTPSLLPLSPRGRGAAVRTARPTQMPEQPSIEYPDWLADAWRLRDQRLKNREAWLAPHLFQQLQAILIAAEQQYFCAVNTDACKRDFTQRLARIEQQFAEVRRQLSSSTISLAQAEMQGAAADSAAAEMLRQFLFNVEEEKHIDENALHELRKELKRFSSYALATAVFEQALSGDGSAEQIRLLNSLLARPGQRQPEFAETLLLRQLAELSAQVDAAHWPRETALLALHTCAKCERLTADARVFAWFEPVISEAAQLRHDGEIMLLAHGYARPATAHETLARANHLCDDIMHNADRIAQVENLHLQTLLLLPNLARYLNHAEHLQQPWEDAISAVRELDVLLRTKLDQVRKTRRAEAAQVFRQAIDELEMQAGKVAALHAVLHAPFTLSHLPLSPWGRGVGVRGKLAEWRSRSDSDRADAALYREMEAALAVPHPQLAAADRAMLWEATRRLGFRLHRQTQMCERPICRQPQPAEAPAENDELARSFRRARTAIALLELAGAPEAELHKLVGTLQTLDAERQPGWAVFGAGLRQLWAAHLTKDTVPALALFAAPPFTCEARLEDCGPLKQARELHANRQSWQGKRWQYIAHDYQGLGLKTAAIEAPVLFYSRHAGKLASAPAAASNAELDLQLASVDLRHPNRIGRIKVKRVPQQGTDTAFAFAIIEPDTAWFDIAPRRFELPAALPDLPAVVDEVPLQVSLNATPGARPAPAEGFLIRVSYADKHFHHAVPAPVSTRDKLQVVLSSDAEKPAPVLDDISIKPNGPASECFVYVQNSLNSPRRAVLEIRDGAGVLQRSPFELEAFELKRLDAGADKAVFTGPLQVAVLDADGKETLGTCQAALLVDLRNNAELPPRLRLALPRTKRGEQKITLTLETENAPPNANLEVVLEKTNDLIIETEVLERLPNAKDVRVEVNGRAGGLAFSARVQDWSVPIDASKLSGRYLVRARLRDAAGNLLEEAADTLNIEPRSLPQVRIVEAPAKALEGAAVELRALASDEKSQIDSVEFFVGLPDEGKVPEEISSMPARLDPMKNLWTARLQLPQNQKGPTPVTVVVTNRDGDKTFDTINVNVAEKEAERSNLGTIEGKVLEGQRPQPGLSVQLLDTHGKQLHETTTAADGRYVFNNLQPGTYQVHCYKPASRRRALVTITVEANKKNETPLPLGL